MAFICSVHGSKNKYFFYRRSRWAKRSSLTRGWVAASRLAELSRPTSTSRRTRTASSAHKDPASTTSTASDRGCSRLELCSVPCYPDESWCELFNSSNLPWPCSSVSRASERFQSGATLLTWVRISGSWSSGYWQSLAKQWDPSLPPALSRSIISLGTSW